MDDLLDSIGKSLINKAMERVLHRFEFPIGHDAGIGIKAAIELKSMAHADPVTVPCGLVIKACTKKSPKSSFGLLAVVIRALQGSGLLKQERIREFYFSRQSSFDETCEVYIFALED